MLALPSPRCSAQDQLGELLDQLQGVAAANAALQKELSAAAKTSDAVEALERRCGALEQANASLLEGQALLREMLEEALAAGQKRAAGELEEANDLRLDLVGARDTLKLLLGTMEAASRHHRELEQNNADIYNSVEVR